MADLLCPKCRAPMESLERSGITLERCGECGGVFLDRGELERLEETEAPGIKASGSPPAPTPERAGSAPSGQALVGDLLKLAQQYRGSRGRI